MTEQEKEAIEWLKSKPQECTNIINSCSNIGNKKAYAKERTMFKVIIGLIDKQLNLKDYVENQIQYCKDMQFECCAEELEKVLKKFKLKENEYKVEE